MPKEIDFSSYECDCGHQSHFFENTIRSMKRMSLKREVRLGDSEENEHKIVFRRGRVVAVICPDLGRLKVDGEEDVPEPTEPKSPRKRRKNSSSTSRKG